jgi:hypothetical protein
MNVGRRIQILIKRQSRADARREANFAKAMRRSAGAKRRMYRLEREMAQTERLVNQLVHEPVSVPSVVRRTEHNLARFKGSLAKSAKSHAEMDRKLDRLRRYMDRKHPLQRPAKANGNRKPHRRGAR